MEPADLTPSSQPNDDPLEQLLRRPLAPLPDGAFSRDVLAALPPSAPQKSTSSLRAVFIAAGAIIGLGVAGAAVMRNGLGTTTANIALSDLNASLVQVGEALANPTAILALVISGLSVAFALAADSLTFRVRK